MTGKRRLPARWLRLALYVVAVAAPMLLTLALTGAESAGPKTQAPAASSHRLALQINTDDPTTMKAVISTSIHLSKYYAAKNEKFSIEIVAYNAGLHMFRADTSPVQELLKAVRATNPDIRLVICEATKLGMEHNEKRQLTFVEGTTSVPNGPARIIELQETGWSYIRS
jgi:intracellular sulfur oxidation DsrE/DsrF family protein